jgi:hypothetical protein
MRRVLPVYLAHLRSGQVILAGKRINKSPEVERVVKAINEDLSAQQTKNISSLTSTHSPILAVEEQFDLELRYSNAEQEMEYRIIAGASLPDTKLRYKLIPAASTSKTGELQQIRRGKVTITPEISIRGTYKTEALIDRLVLLVNTSAPTAPSFLNSKIFNATGSRIFAHDLKKQINRRDWRASLPQLDSTKSLGHHFAILIQDPTPELLPSILGVIRGTHGIDGDVNFHLIEVTVDFYPRTRGLPEETILFREKMVGLLQRHHWAKHSLFHGHGFSVPRNADARQFYLEANNNAKTDFFFAKDKQTISGSDHDLDDPDVRKRLLTTRPGRDLYLNSTIWKGAENSAY